MSISEITRTEPQYKQPSKRKTKEHKQRWPASSIYIIRIVVTDFDIG